MLVPQRSLQRFYWMSFEPAIVALIVDTLFLNYLFVHRGHQSATLSLLFLSLLLEVGPPNALGFLLIG